MLLTIRTAPALLLLISVAAACGSSSSGSPSSPAPTPSAQPTTPPAPSNPPPPSTPDAGPDHGAASSTYPAFPFDLPQVVSAGGPVLSAPELVTITWPGDPNRETFEKLADAIGASAFWKDATSEYGVGPATSAAADHAHMPASLGAQILAKDIDAMVPTNMTGASPAWPAFGAQKIYTMYIPASTKVVDAASDTMDYCQSGIGGYHDSVTVNGNEVVYAVIIECPDVQGEPISSLDESTLSASHEWVEASTDPYANTKPAYAGLDPKYVAYDVFVGMQDELGDMCEGEDDATLPASTAFPFVVQRSWSNKSARAGHSPCVTASSGPYVNMVLLDPPKDTVTFDMSKVIPQAPALSGTGYGVAVGDTLTVPLGFASDAASDPWTLDVQEMVFDPQQGALVPADASNASLKLSLDTSSGQNGQKAYLGVTRTKKAGTGASLVALTSTLGKIGRFSAFFVGDAATGKMPVAHPGRRYFRRPAR